MNKETAIKKTSAKRKANQERRHKQKIRSWVKFGLLGLIVLGVAGLLLMQAVRPVAGQQGDIIPVNASNHIPDGTDPGAYPSDPPAGGPHYNSTLPAKFYDETDLAALPQYPQGYLVHDLEHGYVIFWYNCSLLDAVGCNTLKTQIKSVLAEFNGAKVVAFPWKSLTDPVVATSWGRLLRFKNFDPAQAGDFVGKNRNRSPEPDAP